MDLDRASDALSFPTASLVPGAAAIAPDHAFDVSIPGVSATPKGTLGSIAFDRFGQLYVPQTYADGLLFQYDALHLDASGPNAFHFTLYDRMQMATAVAIDHRGQPFVAIRGNGPTSTSEGTTILNFPALAEGDPPTETGTAHPCSESLLDVQDLAFDKDDDLWISRSGVDHRIMRADAASLQAEHVWSPGLTLSRVYGGALAFDAEGNLWAADGAQVVVFAAADLVGSGSRDVAPRSIFTAGLTRAQGLAFDAAGNLWVVDPFATVPTGSASVVYELAAADLKQAGAHALVPITQLSVPSFVRGIAFDPPPAGLPFGG